MAIFDQQGQHITHQYNVSADINLDAVHNWRELVGELQRLQRELADAVHAGVFDQETATAAPDRLTKAVQEAEKPEPDTTTILDHLSSAKTLIEGISAASSLVTALLKAAEMVRTFF
jgi:CRISPR/Cas system-associated protein Cas10 (large subunit of type III CRISPR-Cas system)